jgi:hypothetical protein
MSQSVILYYSTYATTDSNPDESQNEKIEFSFMFDSSKYPGYDQALDMIVAIIREWLERTFIYEDNEVAVQTCLIESHRLNFNNQVNGPFVIKLEELKGIMNTTLRANHHQRVLHDERHYTSSF